MLETMLEKTVEFFLPLFAELEIQKKDFQSCTASQEEISFGPMYSDRQAN